ncbi:hypothetical protein ANN_13949 [Periplaneta americana]|uniref:Uncharacterized protein n=1 Tax=Periplaneta americana TaxID=6978 RepID=A0ABQ8SUY6_PERAM|nr:hypothetical protein ANN_13949 [Periplaneta americana]
MAGLCEGGNEPPGSLKASNLVLIYAIVVLTIEEKVFNAHHYFRGYGIGHQNRPSLLHVKEQYEERFNKEIPNNTTMLAVVDKFRHFILF